MAEEFQESEVIFSDYWNNDNDSHNCLSYQKKKKKKKKKNESTASSVPVNINIPDRTFKYVDRDDQFEEEDEDGEIVPPHVIVGRRIAGKMAFSVSTGNGRTLKGRDLSRVRNSILRLTGFLET